ncbi:MAG: signal recognition particle protein [Gammaproteobacteria bacterium]
MFDNLTERLSKTLKRWVNGGKLSKEHVKEGLQEVRKALLEADVALAVVQEFISNLEEKALGREIGENLTPAQELVKLVNAELVLLMGERNESLNLRVPKPAVILMAGLQGSGKTTTAAKLASRLKKTENKKVLLASADVYRPAAIEQLHVLAKQLSMAFLETTEKSPQKIAEQALDRAKKEGFEVLIFDTAGRLHIDAEMMSEIKTLHATLNPIETLFVADSMMGQDASLAAKAFHEALPLTGVILTKVDGDARGGAALSIRQITGKPIKFLGVGEKIDALEAFYPDRLASRILGMGDILSLIEDMERRVDKDKAEALAKKLQKGKGFDLNDLKEQFKTMQDMGGMQGLISKLPSMGGMSPAMMQQAMQQKGGDKMLKQMICIIDSMTKHEREKPQVINGSRKRRIANGAGVQIQDVNRLLKQHEQMQKMMKKVMGGGMGGMMKMMKGLQGRIPPGILSSNR